MSENEKVARAVLLAALIKIYGGTSLYQNMQTIDEIFYWLDGNPLNFDAQNNASSNLQTENPCNDDK